MKTKVAAVQMVTSTVQEQNIETASRLIDEAAGTGAQVIALPEYWSVIEKTDPEKLQHAEDYGNGSLQTFMAEKAKKHGIWLVGGSISLKSGIEGKVFNSTLVYRPDGTEAARYDKIHLFSYANKRESYDESTVIEAGNKPVVFDGPFGKVGLTVCYDLRFPELFRALTPCEMIVLPAAFIYTTGEVHWETLLRARAIENQTYVLAAAQGGRHDAGRRTWGHSMLIDPWGTVVSVLEEGEGVMTAEVDTDLTAKIRQRLPALKHKRM